MCTIQLFKYSIFSVSVPEFESAADPVVKVKRLNRSHYRPEVPIGFQEVKVPRLHDNGPRWW